MDEYKVPYLILFNSVADALEALQSGESEKARKILIRAQQNAENAYIEEK